MRRFLRSSGSCVIVFIVACAMATGCSNDDPGTARTDATSQIDGGLFTGTQVTPDTYEGVLMFGSVGTPRTRKGICGWHGDSREWQGCIRQRYQGF